MTKCAGIRYYPKHSCYNLVAGKEATTTIVGLDSGALTKPRSSIYMRRSWVWLSHRRCSRKVVVRIPRQVEGSRYKSDTEAFCSECAKLRLNELKKEYTTTQATIKHELKKSDLYKQEIKRIEGAI